MGEPEREARWLFSDESAALLVARAAWPFDSQVMEWAPRMLTDDDLRDRTIASAYERLALAARALLPQTARDVGPGTVGEAESGEAPASPASRRDADRDALARRIRRVTADLLAALDGGRYRFDPQHVRADLSYIAALASEHGTEERP